MTAVSRLVLTRVAGLPADAVDLVGPATRACLAELAEVQAGLERLAPELVEAFYALVPRLDDDVPLRRKVLAAKRAVNRLAPLGWDAGTRERLAARTSAEHRQLVDAWVRVTEVRQELMAKLDAQLAADRSAAVECLTRQLESPGFARSVALAAPDWIRYGHHRAGSTRNLKTLYSYVSRTAVKTSPFSGLTTVAVAGAAGRGRARSRVSAVLAHHALHRLARDERTAGLLRYRTAPLRPGGPDEPDGLLLHTEVSDTDGVIWRQDRVVEADHGRRWLTGLPTCPALEEILTHIGGADPFIRFRRLLDAGLLHPLPPWRQGEDPLPVLAELAGRADGSPVPPEELLAAHRLGSGAREEGTRSRVEAAALLRGIADGWAQESDRGARTPSGLVYEDRESELSPPHPLDVPSVREDLEALGAGMRPRVFRSHLYDLLVERFTAEFGPGGVCRDPLGFLMRLSVDRDANPPLERAVAADLAARADPGERAWLPVGPSSAPPNAGVLFQVAADGQEQVETADYRLVVNHFSSGTGGLFARFGSLLGAGFRRELASHVQRCWAGANCRELVVWSECNTVQAECTGLLPPLLLPGEVGAPDGITLDDTVLVHDPADGTLSLFDTAGDAVGLVYLGLIPQHLLQSYVRLLAVLADPWVNGSPLSDYTMTKLHELRTHCTDEVVALPRIAHGRVVTRRASWIVPVGALPGPEPGESGEAGFAVRLDGFRRAHAMPEEVFVHQLGGPAFTLAADRKPMWVSLASPLSMGVLAQWLSPATTHVRIVEALPERDQHPQLDAQGRRRVTEHAALLTWPKGDPR